MRLVNIIKLEILEQIENNIKRIYSIDEIPKLVIKLSENEQFGDFTTTAALQIKSKVNKSPLVIAEEISSSITLTSATLKKVEVVHPGYINIFLEPNWKIKNLEELIPSGVEFNSSLEITQNSLEDINYIIQRIDTILMILAREKFIPNYNTISWEQLYFDEEKELLNLFVKVMFNSQNFNKKDMNLLLEDLIKKFYAYYSKLQFRKLDDIRLNVVLNMFLGVKSILKSYNLKL